ncbi:cytochrome p450 [Holotrichia oblita]|uniref:Cytochrome p450 n=1 Tax=Holotrichia oblita TaxID=644536 RepID=A0ACB9T7S2_HOLOL|nr:cytochrome p450 [Holotrichia oblita]
MTNHFKQTFCIALPNLARFLRIPQMPSEELNLILELLNETIEFRTEKKVIKNDFLQLLLDMKKDGVIDVNEVQAQYVLFFLAGYETTASTLTFALYELAYNENVQKQLKKEVVAVIAKHDGVLTYEAVQEMKYLQMVIDGFHYDPEYFSNPDKFIPERFSEENLPNTYLPFGLGPRNCIGDRFETLRKHPAAPFLLRKCVKDFTINDITIERNTTIVIPTIGLHYDPEYYPNPDVFDPERFSDTNKNKIVPYTYLPFGEGPRNCIGDRLGKQQVKVAVVSFIQQFKIKLNPEVTFPLEYDTFMILTPKRDILLDIELV